MSDGDETNKDDGEDFDLQLLGRLLLGFLPVDIDALVAILRVLRKEANKTSWPDLYQRAASFGISLTTIGAIVTVAFIFFEEANLTDVIPLDFTLLYWMIFGMVVLILITFYFLKLMQGIDEGESLIAGRLDDQYAMILELLLGGLLMGTLIFFALQTYQPYFIILVGGIGAVITGLFVAGGALILSGITRVRALVRRKQKLSNTTLDQYQED